MGAGAAPAGDVPDGDRCTTSKGQPDDLRMTTQPVQTDREALGHETAKHLGDQARREPDVMSVPRPSGQPVG